VPAEIIIAVIGLVGILFSSTLTWLVTDRVGKRAADIAAKDAAKRATEESQRVVNESFQILIQALHDDRAETKKEMEEMKQEIQILSQHMGRLEEELVKNGHIVPPRPVRARAVAA